MKIGFIIFLGVEKFKIEVFNEYFLFILKNLNILWIFEILIELVKDNIYNIVDNGREDLFEKFFDVIWNDNEIKKILF